MAMTTSFNPSVLIDGLTIEVENWMVVLAFALRGIPWAVELADSPEYDMRGKIKDYHRREKKYFTELEIAELEERLSEARKELRKLNVN